MNTRIGIAAVALALAGALSPTPASGQSPAPPPPWATASVPFSVLDPADDLISLTEKLGTLSQDWRDDLKKAALVWKYLAYDPVLGKGGPRLGLGDSGGDPGAPKSPGPLLEAGASWGTSKSRANPDSLALRIIEGRSESTPLDVLKIYGGWIGATAGDYSVLSDLSLQWHEGTYEQQRAYYNAEARRARAEFLRRQGNQQTTTPRPEGGTPPPADATGGHGSGGTSALVPDGASIAMVWKYSGGDLPFHYTFTRAGETMTAKWAIREIVGAEERHDAGSCAFDGTLQGSVIAGAIECRHVKTGYGKRIEVSEIHRLTIRLSADGTLSGEDAGRFVERCLAGCSESSDTPNQLTFAGSWQIQARGGG